MRRQRNEKGFTLMELMVVIVIVAILAAVAVPLYINYVRDAQRTEARGAIAAIVTAEQVHLQRFGTYLAYTNADFTTPPAAPDGRLDVDIREALANWTIDVTLGADPANAFDITSDGIAGRPSAGIGLTYHHNRATPPNPVWEER